MHLDYDISQEEHRTPPRLGTRPRGAKDGKTPVRQQTVLMDERKSIFVENRCRCRVFLMPFTHTCFNLYKNR